MSNEKVIIAFLKGKEAHTPKRLINNSYIGQTLRTDGVELINYDTRIAHFYNGVLRLNMSKYSATTSKIQNKIKQLAEEMGLIVEEYKLW